MEAVKSLEAQREELPGVWAERINGVGGNFLLRKVVGARDEPVQRSAAMAHDRAANQTRTVSDCPGSSRRWRLLPPLRKMR
jgi:hypothetical protein